ASRASFVATSTRSRSPTAAIAGPSLRNNESTTSTAITVPRVALPASSLALISHRLDHDPTSLHSISTGTTTPSAARSMTAQSIDLPVDTPHAAATSRRKARSHLADAR